MHEHDSAPSLPMVLCVSAIHQPTQAEHETTAPRPFLELTDGWYRINAEIDDCLTRAFRKGKIAIGRKLAISGAKASDSASVQAGVHYFTARFHW